MSRTFFQRLRLITITNDVADYEVRLSEGHERESFLGVLGESRAIVGDLDKQLIPRVRCAYTNASPCCARRHCIAHSVLH